MTLKELNQVKEKQELYLNKPPLHTFNTHSS